MREVYIEVVRQACVNLYELASMSTRATSRIESYRLDHRAFTMVLDDFGEELPVRAVSRPMTCQVGGQIQPGRRYPRPLPDFLALPARKVSPKSLCKKTSYSKHVNHCEPLSRGDPKILRVP